MQYTKQNPLRCFYAFAGYNSQKMALQRLADNFPGFHHVCVGWSEIDKNAIIANTGNSICVAPMYHIFRKLFIEKECENQQLELF